MTAALRDGILAVLVEHDPLGEASDGTELEPYVFQADELATILSGSGADGETCAVAVWAVLGGAAFGPSASCSALGDEIAQVLERHPGAPPHDDEPLDHEDDDDPTDLPELADAPGVAVLMALISRDPYALGRTEVAVDWRAAYAALAAEVVLRVRLEPADLAGTVAVVRDGALGQPTCPPPDELDLRLLLLREDLHEIVGALPYLVAPNVLPPTDEVADDPLVAGVRAILERHDTEGGHGRGGQGEIAAGVVECLREASDADAALCARVVWAELRRWSLASRMADLDALGDAGGEIADLLDMYRAAVRLRPALVQRAPGIGPGDRLVHAAQDVLAELDPLTAREDADYAEQAQRIAEALRHGVDGVLHCQTVVWRVVVWFYGAFAAGPLSAYRDAGAELLRAVRENNAA